MVSECAPSQNGLRAEGRSRPIIEPDLPNLTPFSSNATMRRGIAAAVPFRVCAKASGGGLGGEDAGSASGLR